MAIWHEKVRVLHPDIPEGSRIIAVSDIHANITYFKELLKKIKFTDNDVLIIVGDFLEKGPASLETLQYIMNLCNSGNAYALWGNCDFWSDAILRPNQTALDNILKYVLRGKRGILYEMIMAQGLSLDQDTNLMNYVKLLQNKYHDEWEFLDSLPTIIETNNYIFVHGGIYPDIPVEEHKISQVMKFDNFLNQNYSFNKWIIVGHWPVMLYHQNVVSAVPIIEHERKIISIDGGCVLKDDGQLNALIIPYEGSSEFKTEWYDPFPTGKALDFQEASNKSYYIRWGDSEVEVLRHGEEFSTCRHVRTGYVMDILTKYLFIGEDGKLHTNDCSDYEIGVAPGDTLSIVEETSRGYYVKNEGVSGWYRGRINK